ncbi:MAG: cytochrome c family protein [Spirochaetes bacterium]|jgi:c(7)-type cytochrome triheme protein|nr:cytochrome c family protein [Spirochaetota bacterium]
MLKKSGVILMSILFVSVFALSLFSEGAVIKIKGGGLGDVSFPHEEHQKVLKDCDLCHKQIPKMKDAIQKQIADNKLKKKDVMNHCIECHKTNESKSVKTGPTKCTGCHKK